MNTERNAESLFGYSSVRTLSKALEQIMATLQKEYQPEKVILFGSMVSGNVGEWTTLLLVGLLVKGTGS